MTERTVVKDKEGLIVPQRPRRLRDNNLPRGGSNHMGKFRRELIQTYNTCVVSQRHVQEFHDLIMAAAREVKVFMKDVEAYNTDRAALQEQVSEKAKVRAAKQAELAELAADAEDPIVRVFSFTDKDTLDKWAEGKGVKLDARQSLENMKAVFIQEYKPVDKTTKQDTPTDTTEKGE